MATTTEDDTTKKTEKDRRKATEEDIREATNGLGPDDLDHLFGNLGIPQHLINHAKRSASTDDTKLQGNAVLYAWRKNEGSNFTRKIMFEEREKILKKKKEETDKTVLSQGSNVTASSAEGAVSLAVQSATPAIYMGQSRVTNVDNRQYHYGQQSTQHPASHTGTKDDGSQHLNISAAGGSHWQIHPNEKPCCIPHQSKVKDPDSSDSSDDDDDIQVADLPQGEQAIPPMHYNKLILEVFIEPMEKNDKLFKKAKKLCRQDWATQNGLSYKKLKRLKPFKFVKRLERCQLLSPVNQEFLLELMKNLEQEESVRKIEKFIDFHKDDILINNAPIRTAVNGKVYTEIVKEGDIKQVHVHDVNRYRKVLNQQLGVPPSSVNFVGSGSNSVVLVFLLPRQWSTVDNEGKRCTVNIVEKLQEAVRNRADWLLAEDIIGIHIEGQPYVDLKECKQEDNHMAVTGDQQEFHYFVQCHEAVQIVCAKAVLPCVENVIKDWHVAKQVELHTATTKTLITLQPCMSQTPSFCPSRVKYNKHRMKPVDCPVYPIPCQNCMQWCHAIECLYWTNDKPQHEAPVTWENISPPKLFHDHIEFAKAFAVSLPQDQHITSFRDFDQACLLKIMMSFGECHRNTQDNHDAIQKVCFLLTDLYNKKVADNLNLSLQDMNTFLESIFELVNLLEMIYPKYFSPSQADDVRDELNELIVLPVTQEMKERTLTPLTANMKQSIQQLANKHFKPKVIDIRMLEGKSGHGHQDTTVTHILQDTGQDQTKQQTDEADSETDTVLGSGRSNAVPASEADFRDITNSLGPDEWQHLVHNLGIKIHDIENAEKEADTKDPRLKARAVLRWWKRREGKNATREALFEAKQKIYRDRESLGEKSLLSGTIHKWRQQLKNVYLLERKEIRFGRRSFDVAEMTDLYVDLKLIEEQGKPGKMGRKKIRKTKGLDSDKEIGRSTDSNTFDLSENSKATQQLLNNPTHSISVIEVGDIDESPNRKTLGSYYDMFKIKINNKIASHLLLFGAVGSGKTTQINKIAYEWAENIDNGSADFSQEELPIHVSMDLVFVLDTYKFQSNQTLAEAVKRQLLPGASTYDIDHVFRQLGHRCLVIFDSFDDISKGVTNHALNCSQVQNLFVITTTRSQMKDQFCRQHKGYAQIQICGFSSENIAEYIKRFFAISGVNDLSSTLIEKVNESLLLQTLASFPVLLVMICLLWEQTNKCGINFHSMTNLYKEFMTKQYLNKPFEDRDILSKHEIDSVILTVGKPALVALLENNITMQEGHFEDRTMLNHAMTLGFMIRVDGKLPGDTSVSFIHKTFQEYCAAFYLCSLFDIDNDHFHSNLNKIDTDMIDHIEPMLRFCCGLSLEVAEAIFKHVVCLVKMDDNPWKVPLMLLYEVELTHDFYLIMKYNFHNQLESLLVSTKLDVPDAYFLAAIVHFTADKYPFSKKWLSHITSLNSKYKHANQQNVMQILNSMPSLESATVGVQELTSEHTSADKKIFKLKELRLSLSKPLHLTSLTAFLPCMPALTTLHLKVVQLVDDMQYRGKCVPFSKCLTELWLMSFNSGKVLDIRFELLLGFLGSMPALTEVKLWDTNLTGDLDDKHVTLSESLREFSLVGKLFVYVNLTQLVSFLSCMPALTKVHLQDAHLTGDLDGNDVTLSASLTEFVVGSNLPDRVYNLNVTHLVSFLSCMPALTKVTLQDAHLTGDLDGNPVTLSASLRELVMGSNLPELVYYINVTHLVSFLSCMPALTKVTLQDAHLTGGLDDTYVPLIESLEELVLIGYLPDTVFNVNVTHLVSLLSCMPLLTKVSLCDTHLTGELDNNHVTLSESLRKFSLSSNLPGRVYNVNITRLVSFLSCMPALTEVTLYDTHLTGDLNDNHVTLSELLRKFTLLGSLDDRVYNVNVTQLVSFLSCMPALTEVTLWDAHLPGDLDDIHVTLGESLRKFALSSNLPDIVYNVNATQLVNFLSCMPSITEVTLQDAHLTGNLDDNHVTLSESLSKFTLFGRFPDRVYSINVTQLVSILSFMPALTVVTLQDAHLTGDLGDNHATLSESLRNFKLFGRLADRVYNVSVTQLVSFLSCMPALTEMSLWDAYLTGDLDDNHATLSESLKEIALIGYIPNTVYKVNVSQLVSFLSCIPALTEVSLYDTHLTGDLDANHVTLSESLRKFALSSNLPDRVYDVNVTQLVSFLSCMPALTEVSLYDTHLTGGLDDSHVTLSESLRKFALSSNLPDRVYNVNVIKLVSFLSCMPALSEMSLYDTHLTGDLDDNHVTLSESLRKFALCSNLPDRVYNVNVTQLVSFLSCMPALTEMSLWDAHLTGNLVDNHVTLSESLKEFTLLGHLANRVYTVNVTQLVSFLSCMPALTKVTLQDVHLTGEVKETRIKLSESLKELWISGCDKVCPDYCAGEWCADDVKEPEFKEKGEDEDEKRTEAHSDKETGEQGGKKGNGDNENKIEMKKEYECVQELSHDNQCSVYIFTLESLLRCMQSPVSVKLNRVAVHDTLDEIVNNILPVQEFSCVNCIISPQVLSMILAQGNSVKSLQLTGVQSQFEEDDVRRIFTTDRLPSLKILKLDNSISETVSGVHHIVNTCLHNLQELYPMINNKDDQNALFDFILDYCSRELGDYFLPLWKFGVFSDIRDLFSKFMSVLQCMPNLRGLDLGRVGLQAEQFQKLASYLSSVQHFQEIRISDTDSAHLMPIIAQTNSYICNLSALRLNRTGLTDDEISKLPWSKLSQLTELDLSCNSIGSEGGVIISDMIRTFHVPLLQYLNLGKNTIGSEGMSALAKSFSHLPLMKSLNLACDMLVSPQALEDVIRNIVHMSCLEVLDLRGPHIGGEDWKQFPILVDCCRLVNWDPSTKGNQIYSSIEINVINEVIKKKC